MEVVKTGELNTTELQEKLQAPRAGAPPSPSPTPRSGGNWMNECATAISKDGTIMAVGKQNLLLLFRVGDNWKITQIGEDDSQPQYVSPPYPS